MTKRSEWFGVDPDGLAQLIGDRGKEFIIFELLQNAWDEASKNVSVEFLPYDRGSYQIIVTDDNPEGFTDISHAFTLFAPSAKKGDPTKAGRFNLGEKLVLALAYEANIRTTKGSILFQSNGTRMKAKAATAAGSIITLYVKMTKAEYESAIHAMWNIIPPRNIKTVINGRVVVRPEVEYTFETSLTTIISDTEGILRPTKRQTTVEILRTQGGWLYELGIPVVATGDKWSYNVHQKVPLNSERTDVTPAYKQDIRVEVLNNLYNRLNHEEAKDAWVRDASSDPNVAPVAVVKVMDLRFGEKRVAYDATDPEANKIAMSKGYTVISGGTLSGAEWKNVKLAGAVMPAGQVTPSPKPFHPDGRPIKVIERDKWTDTMLRFESFARNASIETTGKTLVGLTFANEFTWKPGAACGPDRCLIVNWIRYGVHIKAAFDKGDRQSLESVISMLIHEFSHYTQSDHLSDAFYKELQKLGAAFVSLALLRPELFPKVKSDGV